MPDEPYAAGDELTCSFEGYPEPTYEWTVDGDPGSITSTQVIEEGDHVYVCTATVVISENETCSENGTVTVNGYSKYRTYMVFCTNTDLNGTVRRLALLAYMFYYCPK